MPYLRSVTIKQERESWVGGATSTKTGESLTITYRRYDSHVEVVAENEFKVAEVDLLLPPTTTIDDALNYIARDLNAVTF